jgi:hypothetical protein
MALTLWWRKLVSAVRRPGRPRPPARKRHRPPTVEQLEERVVFAVQLLSAAVPASTTNATANGQSEISPVHSVSDDGNYTVFISTATNLVSGEVSNGATQNVYLYNKSAGTTTLVSQDFNSTTAAPKEGNDASFNPVISGDGSTVAFYSLATDLVSTATVTSGKVQLYVYNIGNGTLTLASHTAASTTTGGDATDPQIPNDVANSYGAVNTLGYSTTVNLGTSPNALLGQVVGGGLALPSIGVNSTTGHAYIAYISNASNLISGGSMPTDPVSGNTFTQVYLYDVTANSNTLVSGADGSTTTGATGFASTAAISGDGSTVAFTDPATDGTDLLGNTTHGIVSGATSDGINDQLYVWSRIDNRTANTATGATGATGLNQGQIVLASHSAGSTASAPTGASFDSITVLGLTLYEAGGELLLFGFTEDGPPSLSSDGSAIAYYDAANNLVSSQSGTTSLLNVFRYNVKTNTNELVTHTFGSTTTAGDNPANGVAPNGAGPSETTGPQISSDGRFIAYANNSDNLLAATLPSYADGTTGRDNVYLYDHDSTTKANLLVSHASGSTTTPDANGGTAPTISSDGRYVAFVDWAYPGNTSSTASSATANVRLFDRMASATTQPTVQGGVFDTTTSALIDGATLAPAVINANTADGTTVAWDGPATTVVSGDTNGKLDVFELTTANPNAPTDITLSSTTVVGQSNQTVGTFTTTDPTTTDQTKFTYKVVSNSTDFTIDTSSGTPTLVTTSTFPTSTGPTLTVSIKTTNTTTNLSFTKTFTLTVIPSQPTLSNTTVTGPSTTVGTATSTDSNGDTVNYSLVAVTGHTNDVTYFTISTTGVLKTTSTFPNGTQTSYQITIKAADSGNTSLTNQQTFTITLVPTQPTLDFTSVPPQANTKVGTATSTDANGDLVNYSLVPNVGDDALFSIPDPTTGVLMTGSSTPTKPTYSITIQATDSGDATLFNRQTFTLTLATAPSVAPSSITGNEASPTSLGLSFKSPDQTLQTVTIANVPTNVTLQDNGVTLTPTSTTGNTATYTLTTPTTIQLSGLTLTDPNADSFNLQITAQSQLTASGFPLPSSPVTVPVTINLVTPALGLSAVPTFDPRSAESVSLSAAVVGSHDIQMWTISWGDGTTTTVGAGDVQAATHNYPLLGGVYTIQATATTDEGTFALPPQVVTAQFTDRNAAYLATTFNLLAGQPIDPVSLGIMTAQLDAVQNLKGTKAVKVRQGIIKQMLNGPFYRMGLVRAVYQRFLHRAPTQQELLLGLSLLTQNSRGNYSFGPLLNFILTSYNVALADAQAIQATLKNTQAQLMLMVDAAPALFSGVDTQTLSKAFTQRQQLGVSETDLLSTVLAGSTFYNTASAI